MPVKICNPSILKLLFNEQNVSNEGIRSNVEARNFRPGFFKSGRGL